jgi:hypothetical protein
LEKWDTYAWKQLENRFEDLAKAWEERGKDVKSLLGWRVDEPGVRKREQLRKEAEDNTGERILIDAWNKF